MSTTPVVSSRQIQADSLRARAFTLLSKDGTFTREDSSKTDALLRLAESLDLAGQVFDGGFAGEISAALVTGGCHAGPIGPRWRGEPGSSGGLD